MLSDDSLPLPLRLLSPTLLNLLSLEPLHFLFMLLLMSSLLQLLLFLLAPVAL